MSVNVCADGLLQDETSLGLTTVCIYGQGRCFILGAMASKALRMLWCYCLVVL